MRRLWSMVAFAALLCGARTAAADSDPHAEMAAALAAQIDAHPAPPVLPGTTATTQVATKPASRHVPPQADLGRRAAEQAARAAHEGAMAALVRQAQAAAMAAAGQAQATAARLRHNPHR